MNENRRSKARTVVCSQPTVASTLALPPAREVPKCDPVPTPAVPVFYKATATVEVSATPERPDSIPFYSLDVTVYCADADGAGPIGDPVTISGGTYRATVAWASVPGIVDTQLDYLSRLSAEIVEELKTASVERVVELTKLFSDQASYFVTACQAARDEVAELARAQAIQALSCVWHNVPTQVECAAGALLTGDAGQPSPINPVTVPGGQFISVVSQEDADAQALDFVTAALTCVWGNTPQTVTCQDLGFTEVVPNDTSIVGEAAVLRVGSVTIAESTFFGLTQAEADEAARAIGLTSLSCFYLNAATSISCPPGSGSVIEPGSLEEGRAGNPVLISEGVVVSDSSSVEADNEAYQLATSLLDCFWSNQEARVMCPSRKAVDGRGIDVDVEANLTLSPVYAAVMAAGLIRSRSSQADADTQALTLATQQLDCIYCNLQINPACIPDSVSTSVVPVPIPSEKERALQGWSLDATPGVAAGAFCSGDAQSAISIGESIGAIPIAALGVESCRYGNDEISVGCISTTSPLVYGLFSEDDGKSLDPRSYPPPTAADVSRRRIVVGANTFTIQDTDVPDIFDPDVTNREKRYANRLALDSGLALLNCFFSNDEATYTCAEVFKLQAVSDQSTDNVTVAAGLFQSVSSKDEAQAQAKALGSASLVCIYVNKTARGLCPDQSVSPLCSGSALNETNPAIVLAGTMTSTVSQEDADRLAESLALSMVECFYTNEKQIGKCDEWYQLPLEERKRLKGTINYVVEAGLFTSYASQLEADNLAEAFGKTQTNCYFLNEAGSGGCPKGTVGPGLQVQQGVFMSKNRQDQQALEDTLKKCTSVEDITDALKEDKQFPTFGDVQDLIEGTPGNDGEPGNDGAQSGCAGKCFGYYS